MSDWVIDSSICLAWALPDERSERADRFWSEIEQGAALHAPSLWWYEIANALVTAHRRGRIDAPTRTRVIGLLDAIPITFEPPMEVAYGLRLTAMAWETEISAYDAAYLELAHRLGSGLATLDDRLALAARSIEVRTWT